MLSTLVTPPSQFVSYLCADRILQTLRRALPIYA